MSDAEILQAAIIRHGIASPGGAPTPAAVRLLAIAYCFREADYARRQSARRSGRATKDVPLTTAEAVALLRRHRGRPKTRTPDFPEQTSIVTEDELLRAALARHQMANIRALAVHYAKGEARLLERERIRKGKRPLPSEKVRARQEHLDLVQVARALQRRPGRPANRDLTTAVELALSGKTLGDMQKDTAGAAARTILGTQRGSGANVGRDLSQEAYVAKSVSRLKVRMAGLPP